MAQKFARKETIISVRHKWTNLSLGSLFGITRQSFVMPNITKLCRVVPNSDPWDRFVHPYLTLVSDSYNIYSYQIYSTEPCCGKTFHQGFQPDDDHSLCASNFGFKNLERYNYTPPPPPQKKKICLWEGILFSCCPSVQRNESVSVTFCFLNILESLCWNFIKLCKNILMYKANTTFKKLRARGRYYRSYFPL